MRWNSPARFCRRFDARLDLRTLAFDYLVEPTLLVDPHADQIVDANPAACTLLGYDRALLRETRISALHAGQVPALIVFTQAVLDKGAYWTNALTPSHATGQPLRLEYAGSRLPHEGRTLMLLTMSDLDQRRRRYVDATAEDHMRSGLAAWQRVERVFQDIERENQLILRAAGEGIYGVNAEGKTTFVNPAAERMLGWAADELVGKAIHPIVHHSHHDGSHYPGRGLPDLCRVPRRRRAQCRRRSVLAQGRLAGVGRVHLDADPRPRHGGRRRDRVPRRQPAPRGRRKTARRAQPKSIACANGWSWKTPICRKKSASRPIRAASSARARRSRRRCARSSWWRRPRRPCMITGESGTGKELIARAIHEASSRSDRPLIRVNCAAIPRELFESEFFGHVKGAFTGAVRDRIGRFELADGGTLFLDEVGEIPLELQGKLLRVLQEGNFERVGEERTRTVDVRLIAATNRDLKQEVQRGRFREDLYFRLNVFPVESVPLRDRREDIPLLAQHFLMSEGKELKSDLRLSEGDARRLSRYDWPGNVRELQNVIERAAILAQNGRLRIDLPDARGPHAPAGAGRQNADARPAIMTSAELRDLERSNILAALRRATEKCSAPAARQQCSTSSRPRWRRA